MVISIALGATCATAVATFALGCADETGAEDHSGVARGAVSSTRARGYNLRELNLTDADGRELSTSHFDINNWGDVVGRWFDEGYAGGHGFVRTRAGFVNVDFSRSGSVSTVLLGINDRGDVSGTFDGFSWGLVGTLTPRR